MQHEAFKIAIAFLLAVVIVVAYVSFNVRGDLRFLYEKRRAPASSRQPWWVRAVLFRTNSRASVIAVMRISMTLAAVAALIGIFIPQFFAAIPCMLLGWGWCWMAVRWADRNSGW